MFLTNFSSFIYLFLAMPHAHRILVPNKGLNALGILTTGPPGNF